MTIPKRGTGLKAARRKLGNPSKTPVAEFRVYGEEMIEKEVKPSGKTGRIYLPPDWVGKHVKIIRID